ncbi:flavodoxin FldB [Pseudidiomarina gelatinasegens]|uniref:Flavodoxin n=1 Tax=Pseudidiomarina gelatinasegens TaxID=2487740 RepID=A0A443Z7C2_9GAMM|nr:flavodoxin FldB [Pseudidiomarina gelatinasegens]RWU12824.1 flavodoxin FldB [Pseudidiomarina gelatinasegens]
MALRIGLFYGSTTCFTEIAAEKIQAQFADGEVELFNIKDVPLQQAEDFDVIIFGLSTWDFGEIQEDWESHWSDIAELELNNKVVALFGMGDQVGYTDWFQDALGMLHDELAANPGTQGCVRIGFWPNQGYDFAASKALTAGDEFFVGLALDEDSQYELSEARIQQWCAQLKEELASV